MREDAAQQTLEIARSLARRGEVDAAVRAFLRVGAAEEAATALMAVERFFDAGQLLVEALGVPLAQLPALEPERRRLAMKAAICFAQAGATQPSVELYLALDEVGRAADVLERAGDLVGAGRLRATAVRRATRASVRTGAASSAAITLDGAQKLEREGRFDLAFEAYVHLKQLAHAARMAHRLGRPGDAAQLLENAAMPFEAAVCFLEAGDTGRCLDSLVRVPREHPKYRSACIQAIRLAQDLKVLDFRLDHFLSRFVQQGPRDEREIEAFYALAKVFYDHDFIENARAAYQKIAAVAPRYRDVRDRLAALNAETRGSPMLYASIVREETAFRADSAPKLGPPPNAAPSLPDLPELPALPVRAEPRGRAPTGLRSAPAVGGEVGSPGCADLELGSVVAGRYRLERKIGQGGMASVYQATDLELGEHIAVKVFAPAGDDPQMASRFKQELSLSRQLGHPNIVRLYDIATHQGRKIITMELLEGVDLGGLMTGPFELARGLRYLFMACAGLHVAHECGIVHRDIKPENFFVTKADVLKVMDFGIAKRQSAPGLTVAGFVAGTPAYMAPEQINNFASVTPLADLYSLGIVAYEMFTGTLPFHHTDTMPLLMMHLTHRPDPPRQRNAAIPPELEEVILQLLEKDPKNRVQSCRELAAILGDMHGKLSPATLHGNLIR